MKALFLLILILSGIFLPTTNLLETLTGVPSKILYTAASQKGFWDLMFNGTYQEKHDFAHGKYTKYGTMPFDSDCYLQSIGWSEKKIHVIGSKWGFAKEKR